MFELERLSHKYLREGLGVERGKILALCKNIAYYWMDIIAAVESFIVLAPKECSNEGIRDIFQEKVQRSDLCSIS